MRPKTFLRKACKCHGGQLFAEHLSDVNSLQELKERLQDCLEDDLDYYRDEVEDFPEEREKLDRLEAIEKQLKTGNIVEAAIDYAVFLGNSSPEFNGLVYGFLLNYDEKLLKEYVTRFMKENEEIDWDT